MLCSFIIDMGKNDEKSQPQTTWSRMQRNLATEDPSLKPKNLLGVTPMRARPTRERFLLIGQIL